MSHDLLTQVCSLPTAPFVESQVVAFVERFVKAHRSMSLQRDRFGNLLISLPGRSRGPRWVFTAHMDHPGFVAERMIDNRSLHARFHGGVLSTYVRGSRVRFFSGSDEIRGTVTDVVDGDRGYPATATVRVAQAVMAGSVGMFDVGEGRIRGKRFHSRVCDDLAGAAAALAMLDQLSRKRPKSPVAVLLTRAEEEGFIGAIAASTDSKLLRKTDRLIAIECSAAQPYAPIGGGCIVRIGDRTSVFNSAISYFITQQAEALAKADRTFKHQRALMPGGTCEATVYDVYGYTAGSICVPLGNYHNMDKAKGKIAAEFIDVNDWDSMVKLFIAIARNGHTFSPDHAMLKQRLEARFEKFKNYF
ncbi:MAG TPA: M20/M25/M40 family metallo-hydrolase [Tepidisphaeraceae bacterium]|jgi:endoglucanase|nr:M20/M25/M40 family metallo-hydrolase [Tepidisphaeraceae bacterium]